MRAGIDGHGVSVDERSHEDRTAVPDATRERPVRDDALQARRERVRAGGVRDDLERVDAAVGQHLKRDIDATVEVVPARVPYSY